ncbi:hypothetical protein BDV06DRAFT_184143 [Aspergillus oleicola]
MESLLYVVFILICRFLQYQRCLPAERPGTCGSCQVPIIRSTCPLWDLCLLSAVSHCIARLAIHAIQSVQHKIIGLQ